MNLKDTISFDELQMAANILKTVSDAFTKQFMDTSLPLEIEIEKDKAANEIASAATEIISSLRLLLNQQQAPDRVQEEMCDKKGNVTPKDDQN